MAKRLLRGDAPTQAQQWRINPPLNAGTVRFRIGNKTLEFATWDGAAIAAAWNASRWAEFSKVTATASGTDVVLKADTAGEAFFVFVTVGDVGVGEGAGVNEVQTIYLLNTPSGGTFNIAFEGDDADVDYDATTGELQTALEGLSTLEAGDVTVTGTNGGPWIVTFGGRFAGENVPLLVVDGTNLTGGNAAASIVTVQNGGATGTPASVDRELLAAADVHATIAGDNPQMQGVYKLGYSATPFGLLDHLILRFTLNVPLGTNITDAEVTIPIGFVSVPADLNGTVYIEDADNPTMPADGDEAFARPLAVPTAAIDINAGYQANQELLFANLGPLISAVVNRPGWVSGNALNLHLRANATSGGSMNLSSILGGSSYDTVLLSVDYTTGVKEIQTVTLAGNPRDGAVELTLDGDTTAALDHDSTAEEVQAELEALSTVGAGKVQCTGGPWPSTITCAFDITLGDLPQMTATDTLVNGGVQVVTNTDGGPAIDIVEEARSRGPNHYDDELNWQDENGEFGLPETGDQVYLPAGKVDLLYGTRQKSTFTANATTNRLLVDGQCALRDGQKVRVVNAGGALPGGLTAGTDYFVRDRDGVFLRLSATLDGAAVDISSAGTGTHTIGVRLARFETDARWTGKFGLPRRSSGDFEEYRPRFLEAWIDAAKLGVGDGSGSARTNLDTRGMATALQINGSAGGQSGEPAVQVLCDGSGNTLKVLSGELGLAIDPDQAAEFDSLEVRGGSVVIGRGVACGDIERTGGTIRTLGAAIDGTVTL